MPPDTRDLVRVSEDIERVSGDVAQIQHSVQEISKMVAAISARQDRNEDRLKTVVRLDRAIVLILLALFGFTGTQGERTGDKIVEKVREVMVHTMTSTTGVP